MNIKLPVTDLVKTCVSRTYTRRLVKLWRAYDLNREKSFVKDDAVVTTDGRKLHPKEPF